MWALRTLKSKWLTCSQLSRALQSWDDLILCLPAPLAPLVDLELGPSAGDTEVSDFTVCSSKKQNERWFAKTRTFNHNLSRLKRVSED